MEVDSAGLAGVLDDDPVRRLRSLFEGRSDAVVALLTADAVLLWMSRAGSQGIFGRDAEDYVGEDGLRYVHPADRAEVSAALASAAALGETVQFRCRALTGDGSWAPVRTVAWATTGHRDGTILVAITVPGSGPRAGSSHAATR